MPSSGRCFPRSRSRSSGREGAGPVGLAAAHSAQFLGAAAVIVGDMNPDRLKQAASFGCETIDLTQDATLPEQIEQILGVPEVDSAVDAVGFDARGHGKDAAEAPATVLNSIMEITRAGGKLGIPGLYVTEDPGGVDDAAKQGSLSMRLVSDGRNRIRSRPVSVL